MYAPGKFNAKEEQVEYEKQIAAIARKRALESVAQAQANLEAAKKRATDISQARARALASPSMAEQYEAKLAKLEAVEAAKSKKPTSCQCGWVACGKHVEVKPRNLVQPMNV